MSPTSGSPLCLFSAPSNTWHIPDTDVLWIIIFEAIRKKFLWSPTHPSILSSCLNFIYTYLESCLYCKILRFLLGCFLTGTSSVPHSPVLSFQGQSKGQGWEVLERVKVTVRKWECQEGAPPLGMEENVARWEIGAGWGASGPCCRRLRFCGKAWN